MSSLDRRGFLAVGGAVATTTLFPVSPATARPPGPQMARAINHSGRTIQLYDGDAATLAPWVCPGPVTFSDSVSGTLAVEWDSRLATCDPQLTHVTRDGITRQVRGKYTVRGSRAMLEVRLPKPSPSRSSKQHGLVLFAIDAVPNRLVPDGADIQPTVVHLLGQQVRGNERIVAAPSDDEALSGPIWGAVLSVLWSKPERDDTAGAQPRFIKVRSAGPAPVPPGTRVVAEASAAAVTGLKCVGSIGSETPFRQSTILLGATSRLEIELRAPLPADQEVSFEIGGDRNLRAVSDEAVRSGCAVWISATPKAGGRQRPTGRDSWTQLG